MSCSLYQDFTRLCLDKIDELIYIANYDFCESDDFMKCPYYKVINHIKPVCEFIKKCPIFKYVASNDFYDLINMSKKFCTSENYLNCERYKIKKSGEDVPKDLYPDGSKIVLKT